MPRFTKTFPTYRDATLRLRDNGYDGAAVRMPRTMAMGPVTITLEGEDAKRALDEDYPIEPGGFRLREIERFG